jgi:hypothetical protein
MKSSPFVDLLTGRAFRPDPLDLMVPLHRRMSKIKFVAVSGPLGKVVSSSMTLKLALVDGMKIGNPEYIEVEGQDSQTAALKSFAEANGAHYAALLLSDTAGGIIADKVSPKLTDEELQQGLTSGSPNAVAKILGRNVDVRDYAVVRHPKFNTCLAFNMDKKTKQEALKMVRNAGLEAVRTQCLPASLCRYLVDKYPNLIVKDSDLVVVDSGFVLYVSVVNSDWSQVLVRLILNDSEVLERLEKLLETAAGRSLQVLNLSRENISSVLGRFKDSGVSEFSVPLGEMWGGASVLEFSALCHN